MEGDGDVRAGDGERSATDARLQRAHGEGRLTLAEYEERSAQAWTAVTRADLDALTADLPPEQPALPATVGSSAVPAPAAAWGRRAGGVVAVAALAGVVLWGGSRLLQADDGAIVFSSTTVPVAADQDRVELGVLFGRARITVPDGVRVVQSSTTIFGSVDCEAACRGTGREVAVDVSGAFASVDILTPGEAAAGGLDDRDDDRDDRDDD